MISSPSIFSLLSLSPFSFSFLSLFSLSLLSSGGPSRHVLNLGHGVEKDTREGAVRAFVTAAREAGATGSSSKEVV